MQAKLTLEGEGMQPQELEVKVGDRVIISRPRTAGSFAASLDRFSTVTAVRAKSFDAGGLCFRYDGREWGGHNRIRLLEPEEVGSESGVLASIEDLQTIPLEAIDRERRRMGSVQTMNLRRERNHSQDS
jgi:hypothetical protein